MVNQSPLERLIEMIDCNEISRHKDEFQSLKQQIENEHHIAEEFDHKIRKTDTFGYFETRSQFHGGCPKCRQESVVNLNNNDRLVCVNPKCDWEWNRH